MIKLCNPLQPKKGSFIYNVFFQFLRSIAMVAKRNMRWREYMAGKRDYDSVFLPLPPAGIWRDPAPNPKDKFQQEWR